MCITGLTYLLFYNVLISVKYNDNITIALRLVRVWHIEIKYIGTVACHQEGRPAC